jgi:SAM-dependent methyltransferase
VTTPRPEPETLARAYADPEYYRTHGIHHDGVLPDHRLRARRVRERSSGDRLLEVGCGEGYLLAALRDEGFQVVGCDLSPAAAAAARTRFGLDVRAGAIDDAPFPAASFDVVVLYHVLEHVPEPARLLGHVGRLLRSGGLLVAEVPNLDAAHSLRPRTRRHVLDLPLHLVHFTPGGFEQLLSRSGFRVETLTIPFGPPFAPLLAAYEWTRGRLRGLRSNGREATPRPSPPTELRHGTPTLKHRLLGWLRRTSCAYKMTAWAHNTPREIAG